jgi:hypothetical protein
MLLHALALFVQLIVILQEQAFALRVHQEHTQMPVQLIVHHARLDADFALLPLTAALVLLVSSIMQHKLHAHNVQSKQFHKGEILLLALFALQPHFLTGRAVIAFTVRWNAQHAMEAR